MNGPEPVLYLNLYATIGGAERALLELVGRLDPARHTPIVALGGEGELVAALRGRGVEAAVVPFPTPPLHGLLWPPTLWRVARAARRLGRQVVERGVRLVQCGDVLGLLLLGPARRQGARLVYQVNYLGGGPRVASLRGLGRRVDALVACSRYQAGQVARSAPELSRRTVVVHPGIDPAAFARGDGRSFRRELGVPDDAPLVGMLARYDVWKGHHVFLDAAARLAAARPAARFAMIGGALNAGALTHVARYRDAVLAHRARLGLVDRVLVVDHRPDVADVLSALDVFALPSTGEPFGMALIEAMAAGRPVAASDTGGPAEIVQEGRSGLLFRTGDPGALAAAVASLLDDPASARRLGDAGRRRVAKAFDAGRYAREMEAVYARLA
ncbi:MAG TPA: glycosyltransferase family 4 protein [Vicinamibacteria bacterium]|nr:glycosyltransferase family 4 protein [Vicinamibacteria bacterium]